MTRRPVAELCVLLGVIALAALVHRWTVAAETPRPSTVADSPSPHQPRTQSSASSSLQATAVAPGEIAQLDPPGEPLHGKPLGWSPSVDGITVGMSAADVRARLEVDSLEREGGPRVVVMGVSIEQTTAEETQQWPDQKPYVEIVHGVRRTKAMADAPHSLVQTELARRLANWSDGNHGWTLVEQRCILQAGGESHTVFPDVAWWSWTQLQVLPTGPIRIAPSLAIEVLSPNDRYGEVSDKVSVYMQAGVPQLWLVDPMSRLVTIHRAGEPAQFLSTSAQILGSGSLEGLCVPLAELFARLPVGNQPPLARD